MTLLEFTEKYRHEFGGMIADIGSTDARGPALAMKLRNNFRKIDGLLKEIFEELAPPNGEAPTKKV